MPETLTNARRWNSFVCPGCRFVFRVPRDHDGQGVVCPACRVMLRLPGPDDELVPLVIPPSAPPEPVEEIEYDEGNDEAPASGGESDWKFIASLVVPALLLLGAFAWWMKPGAESSRPVPLGAIPPSDVPIVLEPSARSMMHKVEETVRSFLEAPTMVEALRHVRDPERTRARMEAWLAGRPYAAPGFHETMGETVAASGSELHTTTVKVRTGDYELREIVLVETDGELRVDWESWVGWSEMPWAEFERERPPEPKWFRVNLSKVDYYNFAFKDDAEWSSYRLDAPDGTASLYGYVPRTSKLDQQIRPLDENVKVKLLLRLKYPPDALSGNQVLIDDVAGEEWVAPDEP